MNSSSPKVVNLHSAHDGAVVFPSFRVVGHGGAVFNIIVLVNYVEEISRQIYGISSKRSRSRLGIIAIQKHRLVSFFMSVVCSEIACENFSLTLPACFSMFFTAS